MIPLRMSKSDEKWIKSNLSMLPHDERLRICKAYSDVFSKYYDTESVDHKKENAGRYAANTRLRIYIEKKMRVFND